MLSGRRPALPAILDGASTIARRGWGGATRFDENRAARGIHADACLREIDLHPPDEPSDTLAEDQGRGRLNVQRGGCRAPCRLRRPTISSQASNCSRPPTRIRCAPSSMTISGAADNAPAGHAVDQQCQATSAPGPAGFSATRPRTRCPRIASPVNLEPCTNKPVAMARPSRN